MEKIFCSRLNNMLKDEKSAPGEYKKLSDVSPKGVKKIINSIPPQERQHYAKLRKIKSQYCK
jgi:rubrerythrin